MTKQLERIIFSGRWLLAPLYLGSLLIIAIYVYRFFGDLWHLVLAMDDLSDSQLLIEVLHLVEIIMLANFLIMVQIGGFTLFVRRLETPDDERAQLQWLEHMDPGTLKVKMGLSLVGVSSVHLLEAFIDAAHVPQQVFIKLVVIHAVFVLSTLAIAVVKRLLH